MVFAGSCHCGNVSFEVETVPEFLLSCNCGICNRYGAQWAYYKPDQVTVRCEAPTKTYRYGDKNIDFHHCPNCGCVTHYTGTGVGKDKPMERMAVNARMCPLDATKDIHVRYFDGADTWDFIGEESTKAKGPIESVDKVHAWQVCFFTVRWNGASHRCSH